MVLLRAMALSLLLVSPASAGRKKKGTSPPLDPLSPVEDARFLETFEDVELGEAEFWVALAQYDRNAKTVFLAVPVARVDDVLHVGSAVIGLNDDGRVQETPFLSSMQIAGLLGGRDFTEHDRHAGTQEAKVGEAIRQAFEQYANGARSGSVYATEKAIQKLGRVFPIDFFGSAGPAKNLLERAVKNEIVVKADRDPSEVQSHVMLVVGEERQKMLLKELSDDLWVVDRRE